jgi:hypothetical protein
MQPTPPPSGERWNVNMPAVIGVVFVFLVGVVIWVVASSGGDGDEADDATGDAPAATDGATGDEPAAPAPTGVTTPPDTSPQPLPSTTLAPSTTSTTAPTTVPPPVTAAPGAGPDAVPGDLGIPGRPMQQPPCDGGYITVLASPIGAQATADGVAAVLDQYPGSNYLRTDQTCPSLTQSSDGQPIYVIFLGPFVFDTDACAARAEGPEGAYARRLSDELGPDHSVACA